MKLAVFLATALINVVSAPHALATWSIIALDPNTGDVGIAAASCHPDAHGDALASLVPGLGVGVTQAAWDLGNRNRLQNALLDGLAAEDVISNVANSGKDADLARRQYGVVTFTDGKVHISGFTGDSTPAWSGSRSDAAMAVSVQGNTLVSQSVVVDALAAFQSQDPNGANTLADRLMRGLEAASAAGGDVRCNRDGLYSTAVTAFILVARGSDLPYAAPNIGLTDQGTMSAPWLAISEFRSIDGENPIPAVRRRFDEWKANQ